VTGLTPGERYVFAVAAYNVNGQLIGGTIGETTKQVLASHPLSMLIAWNYLCQVCIAFLLKTFMQLQDVAS
jgi:hypothetical protein